jgi:hypothetical protein
MIDMPDRAHVDMRLGALKLRFRHPFSFAYKSFA